MPRSKSRAQPWEGQVLFFWVVLLLPNFCFFLSSSFPSSSSIHCNHIYYIQVFFSLFLSLLRCVLQSEIWTLMLFGVIYGQVFFVDCASLSLFWFNRLATWMLCVRFFSFFVKPTSPEESSASRTWSLLFVSQQRYTYTANLDLVLGQKAPTDSSSSYFHRFTSGNFWWNKTNKMDDDNISSLCFSFFLFPFF